MHYSCDDIKKLGTILGVWAHPDDEAWTSAGIMCQAVRNGQRVVCVTATCGEAGETADEVLWPKDKLGEIRCQELEAALEIIGIKEHSMLDYSDGKLTEVDEADAIEQLSALIASIRPDTVLTFGRDGITGHPDHKTICAWTCKAVQQVASPAQVYCATETTERYAQTGKQVDTEGDVYFAVDRPVTVPEVELDLCFKLDSELLIIKENALRAQASQTTWLFSGAFTKETIDTLFVTEGFMKAAA